MDARDDDNSAISQEEKLSRENIERAERVLGDLQGRLRAVDEELATLSQKDDQYALLRLVCDSLQELDDLGAKQLFWGDRGDAEGETRHVGEARRNLEAYANELTQVDERRQAVLREIGEQNEVLDHFDADLRDAMEREEIRKSEWAVEREADLLPYRLQMMHWTRGGDEDRLSRRSVAVALLYSVLIGLLLPMIDLPIPLREELIEVPERVAKLIREVRTPPPPPVEVQEQKVPDEIPEPEPVLAEQQPPDQLPEVADTPVVAEVPKPDTREQVKSKGILAFRDNFAERASSGPTARLGSQASVRTAGQDAIGRPERSMVTTSASGSSGGINLADISRGIGGDGGHEIGGVAVTRVASSIGGGEGPDRPLSGGQSAGRTDEEIQIVFDRYKAALYRLYNRELRKDPTLRGQLVLRLTIEPDGSVSFCQLQSSDMLAPVLAEQVVDRVRGFDFGAKDDIVAVTIIYPIDFLPAV